jgi:predicted ATPase
MARRLPIILFVEDAHWADPSSVELGLQLLSMTAQVPW